MSVKFKHVYVQFKLDHMSVRFKHMSVQFKLDHMSVQFKQILCIFLKACVCIRA